MRNCPIFNYEMELKSIFLCLQILRCTGLTTTVGGLTFFISEAADKVNHVTSVERCSSMFGVLLELKDVRDTTRLERDLGLARNGVYWLGTKPSYMDAGSCLALSLLPTANDTVVQNCSRLNRYICQIFRQSETLSASGGVSLTDSLRDVNHSNGDTSVEASKQPLLTTAGFIKPSFSTHFAERVLSSSTVTRSTLFTKTPTDAGNQTTQTTTVFAVSKNVTPSLSFSSEIMVTREPEAPETSPVPYSNKSSSVHLGVSSPSTTNLCQLYLLANGTDSLNTWLNHSLLNETLLIERQQTSRYVRKLTSATDTRMSSRVMGSVAALVLISVPTIIVAMDVPLLVKHWRVFLFGANLNRF